MLLRARAATTADGEVVAAVFSGSWEDSFQNIVASPLKESSDVDLILSPARVRPAGQDDGIAGVTAIRRACDRPGRRLSPSRTALSRGWILPDRSLGRSCGPFLPE